MIFVLSVSPSLSVYRKSNVLDPSPTVCQTIKLPFRKKRRLLYSGIPTVQIA